MSYTTDVLGTSSEHALDDLVVQSEIETNNERQDTNGKTEHFSGDVEPAAFDSHNAGSTPVRETISARELSFLSTAFTIATFLVAIDGSILSTAIPHITSDFHHLDHVSWYGSAYLLTEMSCQPTFTKIYTLFDAKITYLISVVVFEVGSVVCAAARNSISLIIGRAIAGVGAAGLLCGSLAIFGTSVPLKKRPFGTALISSMFGIAGVLGPTVGGVITDIPRLTWRFCFWMNLPFGAITFVIASMTFKTRPPQFGHLPLIQKLKKLDLLSGFLLTAGLIALFLALQWGGSKYTWANPRVYGCIVVSGLLVVGFIILQVSQKEEATIPIRIISQRTVAICFVFNMLLSMAQITHYYYLAFYFQAVLGTNAANSGVRILAYGIIESVATIITGAFISSNGYYVPWMWFGTSVYIVGCVLLHTLQIHSSTTQWVGYQMVSGLGIGLAEQVPFIAVQVVLPDSDMPTACILVVFARSLGGAIGVSVAENIFSQALLPELAHVQGVNVSSTLAAGISDLTAVIPASELYLVREGFGNAISRVFIMPIAVAGLSLLISFGMERERIQDEEPITPSREDNIG